MSSVACLWTLSRSLLLLLLLLLLLPTPHVHRIYSAQVRIPHEVPLDDTIFDIIQPDNSSAGLGIAGTMYCPLSTTEIV
jgi:hypothetical protein